MKRLLVFGLIIVLFGGCVQSREYYFKFTVLTNSFNLSLIQFIGGNGLCSISDLGGISVGSTCITETYSSGKNANISAGGYVHNDANNMGETYDWQVEFYVNGNLEETRTGTTGFSVPEYFNFIIP